MQLDGVPEAVAQLNAEAKPDFIAVATTRSLEGAVRVGADELEGVPDFVEEVLITRRNRLRGRRRCSARPYALNARGILDIRSAEPVGKLLNVRVGSRRRGAGPRRFCRMHRSRRRALALEGARLKSFDLILEPYDCAALGVELDRLWEEAFRNLFVQRAIAPTCCRQNGGLAENRSKSLVVLL